MPMSTVFQQIDGEIRRNAALFAHSVLRALQIHFLEVHDALASRKPNHLVEPRIVGAFGVDNRRDAHVDERIDDLEKWHPVEALELIGVHETVHPLMHPEHDALDRHLGKAEVLQVLDLQVREQVDGALDVFLLEHEVLERVDRMAEIIGKRVVGHHANVKSPFDRLPPAQRNQAHRAYMCFMRKRFLHVPSSPLRR